MRSSASWIKTLVLVASFAGTGVPCVMAQVHAPVAQTIEELRAQNTTNEARKQLLQMGKSDPDVRRQMAIDLPPLIQKGPDSCSPSDIKDLDVRWHSCPWYNAVELAGKLKIGEAASSLGPWIAVRTSPAVIGLSSELGLDAYPEATALWEIGNPAVPVVQHILESDQRTPSRFIDERVLCIINTSESKAALRDFLPRESDPGLQARIKSCLGE